MISKIKVKNERSRLLFTYMKFWLINEIKTLAKYEIDINIIFDYLKSKRKDDAK